MTLFKHIYNVIAALGRAIAAAFGFYPPLPDGVVRATAAEPIAVGQAVGWAGDLKTITPSARPYRPSLLVPPVDGLTEPEMEAMWAAIKKDIAALEAEGPTEEEHWIDQAAAIVVEHFAVEPELWRTLGAPAGMLHAALSTMGLTSSQRQMLHRLVMHHRKLNRTAKEIAQRGDAKTIPTGRTGS